MTSPDPSSPAPPRAAVVCTGEELLDGRVSDQNLCEIAAALGPGRLPIRHAAFVGDDPEAIERALRSALSARPALLIVTGGLGPTEDDRTRQVAATLAGQPLQRDDMALRLIEERFASRGRAMTPSNSKQAEFPRGAEVLYSQVGTASGFALTIQGARVVFLPGVPSEVAWFMREHLEAMLRGLSAAARARSRHTFYLFGRGESALERALQGVDLGGCEAGWRALDPLVTLTLSSQSDDEALLQSAVAAARAALAPCVLSESPDEPFAELGRALQSEGGSVTTAESCTGGLIASFITATPGSSAWFERGFVTYSDQSKVELLGVDAEALKRHGAVSQQVAEQMAQGALKRAGALRAVAVSGIAGPGGGSRDKPVGTVHLALATLKACHHHRALFKGASRDQVRQRTVYTALSMLLWSLGPERDDPQRCPVALTGARGDGASVV